LQTYVERLFALPGAVALVTGSSAGIGLALARGLAGAGAMVVVNGRDAGKVEIAVAELARAGAKAVGAPFDVTDRAAVGEAVARIEGEVGPIDVLVNNAGIQRRGPLEHYPEATWRELMRANLESR
jgi:gluconate 5-dehydrogenase